LIRVHLLQDFAQEMGAPVTVSPAAAPDVPAAVTGSLDNRCPGMRPRLT
jgi:hypothetical protein